mgnify:CR=1 FL=1
MFHNSSHEVKSLLTDSKIILRISKKILSILHLSQN